VDRTSPLRHENHALPDSVSDRQVTASGKLDAPGDAKTPAVPGRRGVRQPASAINVFWFGWGAVFSSRPEHSQTTGAAAVRDGLVLPRPPRACAARSVLEGGGTRCQPQDSRAGRPVLCTKPAPDQNTVEPNIPVPSRCYHRGMIPVMDGGSVPPPATDAARTAGGCCFASNSSGAR